MFKMPSGVLSESCRIDGVDGQWELPIVSNNQGIVLYLHGGAYVTGSIVTHRAIACHLAVRSQCRCLIINYRLAPEHPFPAGLDDALSVYHALLQMHPGTPIAVAGDSAGGGLAVALALKLRDQGVTPPSALALFSPWTDLTLGNPSHRSKASVDPYFPDSTMIRAAADAYSPSDMLKNPFVSPQFADLSNLPPTLIHAGEREALLDDSTVLAQRMTEQGGHATLKVFPGMWHVWQYFVGQFREADDSIAEMGAFLKNQLQT